MRPATLLSIFKAMEAQMRESFIEARKQNFNETDEQAVEAYNKYQEQIDDILFGDE